MTFRKRIMDQSVSVISPPIGFFICNLHGASDEILNARIAAENQVFNRNLKTLFLHKLSRSSVYRPDLDFILCTSDGVVVAFCTAWFDEQNQIGYFEPVGTSSDCRRRGFVKILLNEGFRLLQSLGASVIYLGHSSDNVAAGQLYESIGLQVFDQETQWEMEI